MSLYILNQKLKLWQDNIRKPFNYVKNLKRHRESFYRPKRKIIQALTYTQNFLVEITTHLTLNIKIQDLKLTAHLSIRTCSQ